MFSAVLTLRLTDCSRAVSAGDALPERDERGADPGAVLRPPHGTFPQLPQCATPRHHQRNGQSPHWSGGAVWVLWSMQTWRLTFTETVRLIRAGRKRGYRGGCVLLYVEPRTSTSTFTQLLSSVWRWGKRGVIYLSLHCRNQNDSCIKMGSDESHFNVSLIVKDKVTRRCPQTTTFLKRKERQSGIEPRSFRLPA